MIPSSPSCCHHRRSECQTLGGFVPAASLPGFSSAGSGFASAGSPRSSPTRGSPTKAGFTPASANVGGRRSPLRPRHSPVPSARPPVGVSGPALYFCGSILEHTLAAGVYDYELGDDEV